MALSAADKRAQVRYRAAHIRRVPLDMQVEEYAKLKAYADARGEPIATLIKRLVRESIARDST